MHGDDHFPDGEILHIVTKDPYQNLTPPEDKWLRKMSEFLSTGQPPPRMRTDKKKRLAVQSRNFGMVEDVKDVVQKQVEDRNQKERNAGLMEAWSHAQYAGETEREREKQTNYIPKILTQNTLFYKCVCSMHTFYTSPYKD